MLKYFDTTLHMCTCTLVIHRVIKTDKASMRDDGSFLMPNHAKEQIAKLESTYR